MKRLFVCASLLVVVASGGHALSLWNREIPAAKPVQVAPAPAPPPVDETQAVGPFQNFPIGKPREIELLMDQDALGQLTAREREDQFLDWLLLTVVSDAGLSTAAMDEALFDLPSVRHGYLRSVATFEYGKTRSCNIGKGQVVAVVPACPPAERADYLADVADRHRKDAGAIPQTVLVFEYRLDREAGRAAVTQQPPVPGNDLFSASAGYCSTPIQSLDDLNRTMGRIDDLTSAEVRGGQLVVGGRRIQGRKYRGIRSEDVAAVWQAEQKNQERLRAFEEKVKGRLDQFKSRWKEKENEFNTRWRRKFLDLGNASPYSFRGLPRGLESPFEGSMEPDRLKRERDEEHHQLQAQCDHEQEELAKEIAKERRSLRVSDHTGFSLDPSFDFAGMRRFWLTYCSEAASLTGDSDTTRTQPPIPAADDNQSPWDEPSGPRELGDAGDDPVRRRMKDLFAKASGFEWKPTQAGDYEVLSELAKAMTEAKCPNASPAPETAKYADQVFDRLRVIRWAEQHRQALNAVALRSLNEKGHGTVFIGTEAGRRPPDTKGDRTLVLKVDGVRSPVAITTKQSLPEKTDAAWLVLGVVNTGEVRAGKRSSVLNVHSHHLMQVQLAAQLPPAQTKPING